jgi:cation transporter family protein
MYCYWAQCLIAAVICFLHSSAAEETRNESYAVTLMDRLYTTVDARVRPGIYGPPTEVAIDFFVQSFGPLNEVDMEFNMDVHLRETWVDPRLVYDSDVDTPLFIPATDTKRFWVPDVYFPNEKLGKVHDLTIPNRSIRLYRNGTVRFMLRLAMAVSCTMHLHTFPLDYQTCGLKISTYSYDTREVVLKWKDDTSIEIKPEQQSLPQYDMLDYWQSEDCAEIYKTGNFSCLMASFYLQRRVGFFVLQTYIPSILIVMLSWVAFWINKNSEPARITLGVTTVLTMTTQLTSSRSNQMRVSYPKAMDVWYAVCMAFVFGALLEYAFININVRCEKKATDGEKDLENQGANTDHSGGGIISWWRKKWNNFRNGLTSKGIDHMARRVFPISFLVFNIIYWITYASLPY